MLCTLYVCMTSLMLLFWSIPAHPSCSPRVMFPAHHEYVTRCANYCYHQSHPHELSSTPTSKYVDTRLPANRTKLRCSYHDRVLNMHRSSSSSSSSVLIDGYDDDADQEVSGGRHQELSAYLMIACTEHAACVSDGNKCPLHYFRHSRLDGE